MVSKPTAGHRWRMGSSSSSSGAGQARGPPGQGTKGNSKKIRFPFPAENAENWQKWNILHFFAKFAIYRGTYGLEANGWSPVANGK